jgi:hypothetical protein
METTPIALRDVLARIESQNDLGKTSWYEVVYHNGEEWCSCAESNTFSNYGDTVVDWVYCDEVLPRGITKMLFVNGITHGQEYDVPDDYDTYEIPHLNSFKRQQYKRHRFYNGLKEIKVMVCGDLWEAYEYLVEQGKL